MIKLEIPRQDEQHLSLVDKLTELALAHQVRTNNKVKRAILTDGTKKVLGIAAITDYLKETEEEMHQWWYCAC